MRLKASPLRSGVLSPVTTAPAHREPPEAGGMVLGKFHFDFSMLVFSVDFPTDTKSRWKRTKTVGTAKQRHKDAKMLPRAFCWNTMQPVNCIPGSCVLLLVMIVLYFVLSPVWLFNFQILHSMTKNDVDQLVAWTVCFRRDFVQRVKGIFSDPNGNDLVPVLAAPFDFQGFTFHIAAPLNL